MSELDTQAVAALELAWPGCTPMPGPRDGSATARPAGVVVMPWVMALGWCCSIWAGDKHHRAASCDTGHSARAALADALVVALADPGMPAEVSAELHAGLTRLRSAEQMDAAAKAEDGSV